MDRGTFWLAVGLVVVPVTLALTLLIVMILKES